MQYICLQYIWRKPLDRGAGASPASHKDVDSPIVRCRGWRGDSPRRGITIFTWHLSARDGRVRRYVTLALVALVTACVPAPVKPAPPQTDWANLARFRLANNTLPPPVSNERRVIFMGNSITENWQQYFATMFAGKPYINRGISGQTTPQMLVRFRADVIALKPAAVVILAGTNDIAGNTGPSTLEMIEDNIASMAELASANGIKVVLSSVLPVRDYPWKPGLEPAPKIIALNAWIKSYAAQHGAIYVDFHSAMADADGGMRSGLSSDGVHPNEAGYRIMAPLVEQAIAQALQSP